ncbi:MAG: endonuclease/exonuclease/phosphatase family protein, partial [Flavobacteriales bacterium]
MKPLKFLQINLQHSKSATAALCRTISLYKYDIVLVQEPYVYKNKICGLNSCNSYTFSSSDCDGNAPRTAIVVNKEVECWNISHLTNRDTVAVGIQYKSGGEVCRLIVASVYLPYDVNQPPPSKELTDIVEYCKVRKLPLIVGCDANSHHTVWGSTDINKRGEHLLEYLLTENLDILNAGTEPTFVNRVREEVIDITVCSSSIRDMLTKWCVLDEESFSDHRYIAFDLKE